MEVGRLKEPLFRPNALPLLSFLMPSVTRAQHSTSTLRLSPCYTNRQGAKAFSTRTLQRARNRDGSEDNQNLNLADIFNRTIKEQPQSPVNPLTQRIRDIKLKTKIDAKLDKMFPSTTGRSTASSADGVRDGYDAATATGRAGLGSGSIARSMLMPNTSSSDDIQRQVATAIAADTASSAHRSNRTLRSRPSLGRTVEVEPAFGNDFGTAYRKLSILLAQNKVKVDLRKQKYYERAGAKRKRLKSERWRTLFKTGFRATVGRVKMMRRQGW